MTAPSKCMASCQGLATITQSLPISHCVFPEAGFLSVLAQLSACRGSFVLRGASAGSSVSHWEDSRHWDPLLGGLTASGKGTCIQDSRTGRHPGLLLPKPSSAECEMSRSVPTTTFGERGKGSCSLQINQPDFAELSAPAWKELTICRKRQVLHPRNNEGTNTT